MVDFLLLSLMALATFDPAPANNGKDIAAETKVTSTVHQDLIEVLQISLDAERENKSKLAEKISQSQDVLKSTQENLDKTQKERAEIERQKQIIEKEKAELEAVVKRKASLEKDYEAASKQLQQAQSAHIGVVAELKKANEAINEVKIESSTTAERLRLAEKELDLRDAALRENRQSLESLRESKAQAEFQRQKLELELAHTRQEVESVKKEKQGIQKLTESLAQSVGTLAETQTSIKQELKDMQPQTLNQVFERYKAAELALTFSLTQSGFFGDVKVSEVLNGVPVRFADSTWILFHRDQTPLRNSSIKTLDITVNLPNGKFLTPTAVGVLRSDSRIVGIQIPPNGLDGMCISVFEVAHQPLRFPESIAISPTGIFGEILLKQFPDNRRYYLRDAKLLSSIPGEISARSGYCVFDKTARFAGIMVNKNYAFLFNAEDTFTTFATGSAFEPTEWSDFFATIKATENSLPEALR